MIHPVDGMDAHLITEGLMGGIGFGHHQKSAGVLVDAVHNAGADCSADARELPRTVIQQRVDQRAVRIAGRRMNHHSLWLVHHQQERVLVDNFQRNVLGYRFNGLRVGQNNLHHHPRHSLLFFVDRPSAGRHLSVLHQGLDLTAGKIPADFRQPAVHPLPALLRRNREFTTFHAQWGPAARMTGMQTFSPDASPIEC